MIGRGAITLLVVSLAIVSTAMAARSLRSGDETVRFDEQEARRIRHMTPPGAPPADPTNKFADDARAAELGQLLFFEPRLSGNGAVSCATCHEPDRAFSDARPHGVGLAEGTRRTQSLLDSAHHSWFTWDGRADTLWSQALHPFEHPAEMGMPRADLIERVKSIPALRARYVPIFGDLPPAPPDATSGPAVDRWRERVDAAFANLGKAIEAYERLLRSGPSRFDRFVERFTADDSKAAEELSPEALRGLKLFVGRGGCWRCHHGPTLSDDSFHVTGVPPLGGGLPRDRGRLDAVARVQADPFNSGGRFSDDPGGEKGRVTAALTADPDLWGAVRTPGLRNVAKHPPYMHEGQFATLEEVVRFYSTLEGAVQLEHHREGVLVPLNLEAAEIRDLVAFLNSLDGDPPAESLRHRPGSAVGADPASQPAQVTPPPPGSR